MHFKLISSEHGFDDYDVQGHDVIHRICVPHSIRKGGIFNVYHGDSSKSGFVWQGDLPKSMAHPGNFQGLNLTTTQF